MGVLEGLDVFFDLGNAARADEDAGDLRVAEVPDECHLCQALAAAAGDFVKASDAG